MLFEFVLNLLTKDAFPFDAETRKLLEKLLDS
jgi:hypothetical protein